MVNKEGIFPENNCEELEEILTRQTCDIIRHLDVGAYVVSPDRTILLWNDKSKEITGYYPEEVEGTHCQDNILKHVDDNGTELCLGECPLAKTLKDGKVRRAKVYLRHKLGYRLPVRVETVPLYLDGEIKGAVEFFLEDTEEINLLEELREAREKALVCALTEVGNRRFAEQVLAERLAEMKRLKSNLGLFFIDIDDFKKINDTYGHPIGDLVLKMVARTLVNIMRPYDFIGRWGGEEFIVVLPHIKQSELFPIGERFRKLISASSFRIPNGRIGVTISIGATLSRDDDTVESIVKRADEMMYISKRDGKNKVTVYSGEQITSPQTK